MERKKRVENDFLTKCVTKGYLEAEIKKAFFETRKQKSQDDLLVYFMDSQKSDNPTVRKIAKELSSTFSPEFLWGKLSYLAKCQRSKNTSVTELASSLIRWIFQVAKDKEKIEKLDYLIACHRSRSKAVREFGSKLAERIGICEYSKKIDVLISYVDDKNLSVREFTREYAVTALHNCASPVEELEKRFDFIMTCTESNNPRIFEYARELSLKVMEKWPTEKLAPYLEYLLFSSKKLSGEERCMAMNLSMSVIVKWNYQKRKDKLDFFLHCWKHKDYYDYGAVRPKSLGMILGVIRYYKTAELAKYLDVLIACQEFKHLQKLSRRLTFKIETTDLSAYEKKIDDKIKMRNIPDFSDYQAETFAVELKLNLMSNWSSEKLSNNLYYIFACHNSDEKRLRLKAKKLASRIDPKDLTGKALRIIELATSASNDDFSDRNMEIGLILPINPDEFLGCLKELIDDHCDPKKYDYFKKIAFRISPEKFDVKKLFELDGYYHLGGLLALRTMKNWEFGALKPYADDISCCVNYDRNKELNQLAEKLHNKIKYKEFDMRRISRLAKIISAS